MLRTEKERIVSELANELGAAETLIVADYRGLTNKQLEALRDELIQHGARFRIVKNTLTRRAAEQAGAEALLVLLDGPTAIAFIESGGDPAAVAKALASKARETNVLTLRGGILEGKALSSADVDQLATLPPLDILRGQLVGAVVAPLTQLLGLVSAPLRDLVGLIDARIEQLEEQGEIAVPAEATAAEPTEPSEPAEATEDADTESTPAGSAAAEPAAQELPAEKPQVEESRETQEEEEE